MTASLLENLAAFLGLAYLLLAMRERREAWIAGGIASGLFLWVFARSGLPMQSALQLYYIGVAVHAWRTWGRVDDSASDGIRYSDRRSQLFLPVACVAVSAAIVFVRGLGEDSQAWLDTLTSCGSLVATWLVAQKRLEAWLYWVFIDAATTVLYFRAGLHSSALLYVLYTGLALVAWITWRKRQTPLAAQT